MSALQLNDHVVLVTGALGTLGSAMCTAIAAAGGRPIRSDLASRGKIDIALDVTREEDWTAAMDEIERTHGRLDGLVNNAGLATPNDIEHTQLRRVAPRDGRERRRRVPGLQARHAAAGQIEGALDRQHLLGLRHRRRRQPRRL